ncbi:MAG: BamA/TamA family outer membrane protein [Sphingomonadales bacterium]
MHEGKSSRFSLALSVISAVVLLGLGACGVIPKNYPKGKPFVFKTTIKVNGNFSDESREDLEDRLRSQLDDSLMVRSVSKLFVREIRTPPVFDSSAVERSIAYMKNLLGSQGYFLEQITYDTIVEPVGKDQLRTSVRFQVTPGPQVVLDSVRYAIRNEALQRLTLSSLIDSKIKKGEPFSKTTISAELDRLVDLYRNNGYLRFTREELLGVWDTLDARLLAPTTDPVEQLRLLADVDNNRLHPDANLEIRLRPGFDSSKLTKYFIGAIDLYPDFTSDTAGLTTRTTIRSGLNLIAYRPVFHPGIFREKIFFYKGDLYDQRNYFKTLNQLSAMGAWRLINIEPRPRPGTDTTDLLIRLTPARKYSNNATLEGSSNQSLISGNLFGIALNLGLQNRNWARRAIQSNTSVRFGVETGRDRVNDINFIQTRQLAITHNLYFPRAIPRANWLPPAWRENFKSVLTFNVANTERRELFNLSSYSAAWGYDFRHRNALFTLRLPNIEYNAIARRSKLEELIAANALLKNIFVDGLISSVTAGVLLSSQQHNRVTNFRFNIEESGMLTGLIRNPLLDSQLFRFVKVDLDLATKISIRRAAIAMRFFAGVGYEFDNTVNPNKRFNLPLYRQYFAGGPNSMRAWGLRKLGPGSSVQSYGNNGLPERYGDLQLEANLEYRFPFFTLAGFKINGALFTDIGNIWYVKQAPGRRPEEVFSLQRLGKDLAVGVGSGLRIDFTYFVIRLDYSVKAKDPSPSPANAAYQNKWFGYKRWSDMDQFQLGINYPFIL